MTRNRAPQTRAPQTAGEQSVRSTLIWAAVAVTGWAAYSVFVDHMPLITLAWLGPLFFLMVFGMMRFTNRISVAFVRRAEARRAANMPVPAAPPEPSSERPEHAQRRRMMRRPRGGTRRRP